MAAQDGKASLEEVRNSRHVASGVMCLKVEDLYEREFHPVMHFKEPKTLKSLVDGDDFELDSDMIQREFEEHKEETSYDGKELYNHVSAVALDAGEDTELTPFEALSKQMVKLTDDGGVMKKTLQQGVGDKVSRGYTVFIHYAFFLEYADEPFDSSRLRGKIQKLVLCEDGASECQVIVGLDTAVASMRKSELARFLIQPHYAFGPHGIPPRIPENSTIMAEVELLNFMATGNADAYLSLPAAERESAPFDMCLEAVVDFRTQGNELFKQKRYDQASRKYGKAVRLLDEARLADDADERKQQKELLKNLVNCALSHVKQSEWKRAIHLCNRAISIDPQHAKAHYLQRCEKIRVLLIKGKSLMSLNDLERCRTCLLEARRLQPSDSDISKALESLDARMRKNKLQERVLCERMFASSANTSTNKPKQVKADGIDPEFGAVLRDMFRDRFADESVSELPIPLTRFTASELDCIRKVAAEMNLTVEERGEGENLHVKIVKSVVP